MSGIIRVTPEELINMANKYGNERDNLQHLIGNLDKMKEDLKGMWQGSSSTAFQEQYEQLKPSFDKMKDLLEQIRKQLDSVATELERADNDIARQIRG